MIDIYILFTFSSKEKEYIKLKIPKKNMTINRLKVTIEQACDLLIDNYYSNLNNDKVVKIDYFFDKDFKNIKISHKLNIEDLFKLHFFINEEGIWDSKSCYECCSDCSSCCEESCPLDFEDTCDNCIFKDGHKRKPFL